MLVTIGQPGLFPWWGTFAKAAVSDVVIHLDHVTWQKSGYLNRYLISSTISESRYWCTLPLHRANCDAKINTLQMLGAANYKQCHIDKIRSVLGRCRADENLIQTLVSKAYSVNSSFAADAAVCSTELLSDSIGLGCSFVRSSELKPLGTSTEMLIGLIKAVGGNSYLFGPGKNGRCQQYLDVQLMKKAGIRVGIAVYGERPRVSILQDLWLGGSLLKSDFPMTIEWL